MKRYWAHAVMGMTALAAVPVIGLAQSDPFSAVRGAATPPSNTASSPDAFSALRGAGGRVGATSASGAAGRSYAAGSTGGFASLSQIAGLPRTVAPIPIKVTPTGLKYLKGRTRVALTGYTLGVVRSGAASAYAGGAGSEQAGRRVSITTTLVGVDDALPARLADEAYKDLAKRLTEAGFELVPNDQVQASPIGQLQSMGAKTVGANKVSLYAPEYAPIRTGSMLLGGLTMSAAAGKSGDAAKALDAIVLNPSMLVDYENIGGSGTHNYGGSASVDAEVRFHLNANSGAMITVTPPPPYKGGWPGSLLMPTQMGTGEQFGIMYETDDKSDDRGLHNAIAMAGLGDIYRQSKVYAVEVDPGRYAALVRAGYVGLNTAIVAEMVKARGA